MLLTALRCQCYVKYSEIPLLWPPKITTIYSLKTLFWNFKLFFSSFSTISVHLIRDHLWDCPKVVFKITFGQSQRWSYYWNFTVYHCRSNRKWKLTRYWSPMVSNFCTRPLHVDSKYQLTGWSSHRYSNQDPTSMSVKADNQYFWK